MLYKEEKLVQFFNKLEINPITPFEQTLQAFVQDKFRLHQVQSCNRLRERRQRHLEELASAHYNAIQTLPSGQWGKRRRGL